MALRSFRELSERLARIDGRGYGAYREIAGRWRGEGLELIVDQVQGDPFATPSRVRLRLPNRIPKPLWSRPVRRMALADLLLRLFKEAVAKLPRIPGSGHSGEIWVDAGGAEVLLRSGCAVSEEAIELRFRVGLPARGRTVLGRAAAELLTRHLPEAAGALSWERLDQRAVWRFVDLVDDHAYLQEQLPSRGLVAFIANGSILPRRSGVSSRPLPGALPFHSPPELEVTLETQHHGPITGMGLPEGLTLITGGGFHGKTTLLEAIQLGVYPHIPGDGREWVVTRRDGVKVRSEEGRAVIGVDLSPFISDLPGGATTENFTTQDASGSTSLSAAILEALEIGSRLLLFDEDSCATNLLVRDARMQALVARETITPLIDRARELVERFGISLILVIGGCGDYLELADRVVLMEAFRPKEVTARAREIAERFPTGRRSVPPAPFRGSVARAPLPESLRAAGKVKGFGLKELRYGEERVDLEALEQLVDPSQVRALGPLLELASRLASPQKPLSELVSETIALAQEDLYRLGRSPELALPRREELAATINRLRRLQVVQLR